MSPSFSRYKLFRKPSTMTSDVADDIKSSLRAVRSYYLERYRASRLSVSATHSRQCRPPTFSVEIERYWPWCRPPTFHRFLSLRFREQYASYVKPRFAPISATTPEIAGSRRALPPFASACILIRCTWLLLFGNSVMASVRNRVSTRHFSFRRLDAAHIRIAKVLAIGGHRRRAGDAFSSVPWPD